MFFRFIFIICFMIFIYGCYYVPERASQNADGTLCGTVKGLFRHRWWNYYERGLSFADCGLWEEAEADLREAVKQRTDDKRRARTYGVHFIPYFPHRELGYVLFRQGRINEAVHELEVSVSMEKSAKAEYYLDEARKTIVINEDKDEPQIIISGPSQSDKRCISKEFTVRVEGIAKDDKYVRHINVRSETDSKNIPIDVSAPEIRFKTDVNIKSGEQAIYIYATDLAGKKSETSVVRIFGDHRGPIISIAEIKKNKRGNLNVKIDVSDDSGIKYIEMKGMKTIKGKGKKNIVFSKYIDVNIIGKNIAMKAEDIAGNITKAYLDLSEYLTDDSFHSLLSAYSPADPELISDTSKAVTSVNRRKKPRIQIISPLCSDYETLDDFINIDGAVFDRNGLIKEIIVGKEDKNIVHIPYKGYQTNFSERIYLEKEYNRITVSAIYKDKKSGKKEYKLKIRKKPLHEVREPLKIYIPDFKRLTEKQHKYENIEVEDIMYRHMLEKKRFMVERIHNGPEHNITFQDCLLSGFFEERPNGLNLSIELKYASEKSMNIFKDAYTPDKKGKDKIIKTVIRKLHDELPVLKGIVWEKKKSNREIMVDIGKEKKIRKGIRLLIYRAKDSIHPTLRRHTISIEHIGKAEITRTGDKESYAKLMHDADKDKIVSKDLVITY